MSDGENSKEYTGIILAGGKSSRMGSEKGLVKFQGLPLIQYSINLLSLFCREILISSSNKEYLKFGLPVIPDEFIDKGPAGGISSALKVSKNDWNIVLSCDVPLVNQDVILNLISALSDTKGVVPFYKEKAEPLIAIYHKTFQPVLEREVEKGHLKMQTLVRQNGFTLLDFEPIIAKFPLVFRNFNFQQDLKTTY